MLTEKKIEIDFALGNDATFNPNGDNFVTLKGHRTQVSVSKAVGPRSGEAMIRVYGLAPSLLNKLASLDQATALMQANTVTVRAGDDVSGMAIVFIGQVVMAHAEMSQQPETALEILAIGTGLLAVQNVPPTSCPGSADAAVILSNLAALGGLDFHNYGASAILSTPYFWGDPKHQIDDCVRAARFGCAYDDKSLTVWPGGTVPETTAALVSPETGLVGYPGYSTRSAGGGGVSVKTIFNPTIRVANLVQVQSSLIVANGLWHVFNLRHELEAMVPGGQWFTYFDGLSNAEAQKAQAALNA